MMKMNARQLGNTRLAMLNKPRELATRAEFAKDIRRNWLNALEATVQVGRRLNEAKEKLPYGEYEAMVEQDLPFKPATARKLREVAAFVDSGKVPLERLPEAYSTVYAIATMPEERRQEALKQGVIRPGMARRELEQFKTPLPHSMLPAPASRALVPIPTESTHCPAASLETLFAGTSDTALTMFPSKPAVVKLLAIDVEVVPSSTDRQTDAANEEPSPPNTVELMALPWYVDRNSLGTVLAAGDGVTVLVINPHRDTKLDDAAAVVLAEHIAQLHNATLRGGC
ncbi:DUF3102 domain-containing protein (plasmid) [Azospirillum argentinense]|uniref:DUF3102 domain-containing protein n=1 Tax=Azospirillum argentinense TaxID=2970906 RepID=A0A4D8PLW8_9PROT|nr:DUF3102 domain-containing protein [Azospirillum argentinense]QCN96645.1 DUF3102 domain-containing protein [Azospirillum argentinense]